MRTLILQHFTHSNKHKYYQIMHTSISTWQSEKRKYYHDKHKYCHDSQSEKYKYCHDSQSEKHKYCHTIVLWNVRMCTCVDLNLGKVAGLSPLRGVSCEQKHSVPQPFESIGWPRNVEVTDVCDTESTVLSVSLDKPCPFVIKLSLLQSFWVLK